jgi:RHS repeat-associated protein
MKRVRNIIRGVCSILTLFCCLPCTAQVPTGTPPFGTFGGGPDVVNLSSLNVHFVVPIINKQGRGISFTYNLSYDTSVWYPLTTGSTQVWTPANNWGWNVQTEPATGYVSFTWTETTCTPPPGLRVTATNFVYHDMFGGSHAFVGSTTTETGSCGIVDTPLKAVAIDDSGYTISALGTGPATITSRSGKLFEPPTGTSSGAGTFTDTNGNQITVNNTGQFFDTLSSTTPALTIAGTAPNPVTMTYTAPSGGSSAFKIKYTSYNVQTDFGCTGTTEYSATNVPFISEIDLPDVAINPSDKYTFTYEFTSGNSGPITGRLASYTLPTGGTTSYVYTGSNKGIECSDGSAAGLSRTTPDGEWKYARAGTAPAMTTTMTDPQSNKTVLNFQGLYETGRTVYQNASTLLETVFTCYNGNTTTSTCNSTAVSVPINERSVFPQWPGGLESRTDAYYNSYGLFTSGVEYAYGSGTPGSVVRNTFVDYASLGNGIVGMPGSVTVQDAGNNVLSQTTYCYDEGSFHPITTCSATGPPTTSSGTPQHISITGSRGNLTKISYSTGPSVMFQHFTYWDTGNVITATDVNAAQSTYTYGTGSCGNSFPTSVSEPASLSRSITWNCTGGVQTSVVDENNHTTSATFNDPYFWRTNKFTDAASNLANFTYTAETSVESSLVFNNQQSTTDFLTTADSLGRTHISQRKQGPSSSNYDSIETDYDSLGRPSRVTLPYPETAGQPNSAAPSTITTYDALNRVAATTDSGGGSTTYSYMQNDVVTNVLPAPIGENSKRRQLEYDPFGRLTSVCEITSGTGGGTCGQTNSTTGFWTKYTYDLNDNLVAVSQNAQASSGSQMTRTYTYDDLGRKMSESNPETGMTAYTYDTDAVCGTSTGDRVKRVDAIGNTTCYAYDVLHRPTSVTYSGPYSSVTPNKYFVYDSATVNAVVMANAKTHVAEIYTAACKTCTKYTDEGFSYTALGQLSDVYESTPNSGGYYHLNAIYWQNGGLNQIGGLSGLPTLSYTPDGEGRPAIVTAASGQNPVESTQYNTASLPTSMTLGSGDSDSFNYDTSTNRITQYTFDVNGQSLKGVLGWNENGTPNSLNITDPFNSANTQNCAFVQDDLTRIASVNCGAIWGQNFTYDVFGNIVKTVITGDSGTSFQPTYSAPPTNQIASLPGFVPTYDANGNLTKDPQHQYSWDCEGRPVTIDSISLTYDGLGRMVEQNNAGVVTQIVFDPLGDKFALMNGQSLNKAFAPLPDGGIAAYTQSGLTFYTHPDWLGSSRLASNPTQGIYADTAYAPFGETYAQTGSQDASFTGQNEDTTSNLYDFMFREYSPIQGRWVSPDPAGLAAVNLTDPQSWNRYAYVRNQPLLFTDPTGLTCFALILNDDGTYSISNQTLPPTSSADCTAAGGIWITYTSSITVDGSGNQVDTGGGCVDLSINGVDQGNVCSPGAATSGGLDNTPNTFANCVKNLANAGSVANAVGLGNSRVGNLLFGSTTGAAIQLGQDISNLNASGALSTGAGIAAGQAIPAIAKSAITNATTVTTRIVSIQSTLTVTSEEVAQTLSIETAQVASQSVLGKLATKALGAAGLITLGVDAIVTAVAVGVCYNDRGGFQ